MDNLRKGILVKNNVAVGVIGDKYFSTCPLGTVLSYAGTTIPRGFLVADGASYKVADYPDLYAVIGNTYGGDTENFNVPNLVDKFIQGSTTSGEEKEAGLPNITGKFYHDTNARLSLSGAFFSYTGGSSRNLQNDETNANSGYVNFDASKSNTIYGNSDTVQPPALTMLYIIKAFHTNEGVDSKNEVSDPIIEYVEGEIAKVESALDDKADADKVVPLTYRTTVTNANDLPDGFISANDLTNAPQAGHIFYRTFSYDGNSDYRVQEATLIGTTRKLIRYKNQGTWESWEELATMDKLGGLTFSASGTTLSITDGTNTWTLEANS